MEPAAPDVNPTSLAAGQPRSGDLIDESEGAEDSRAADTDERLPGDRRLRRDEPAARARLLQLLHRLSHESLVVLADVHARVDLGELVIGLAAVIGRVRAQADDEGIGTVEPDRSADDRDVFSSYSVVSVRETRFSVLSLYMKCVA